MQYDWKTGEIDRRINIFKLNEIHNALFIAYIDQLVYPYIHVMIVDIY